MRHLILPVSLLAASTACGQKPQAPAHDHGSHGSHAPAPTVEHGADDVMSGGHGAHATATHRAHLRLSPARPGTAADTARAREILTTLRLAVSPYADTAAAVADGYRMFAPGVKQRVYHFTKGRHAVRNEFGFDAARPTSLLYERGADGRLRLAGAMYTAPRRSKPEDLDARVPLSIAQWHLHTNVCVPGRSERERWRERRGGQMVFGPAGAVATKADCDAVGGKFHEEVLNWMVHVDVRKGDDVAGAFGERH